MIDIPVDIILVVLAILGLLASLLVPASAAMAWDTEGPKEPRDRLDRALELLEWNGKPGPGKRKV